MSRLLSLVSFCLSVSVSLAVHAQLTGAELERAVARLTFCDAVHKALAEFTDYKDPNGYRFYNKSSYLEKYQSYIQARDLVKKRPIFLEIKQKAGDTWADSFLQSCDSEQPSWIKLAGTFQEIYPEYGMVLRMLLNEDGSAPSAVEEHERQTHLVKLISDQREQNQIQAIVVNIERLQSLSIERDYFITLEMRKTDKLNPFANIVNDLKAVSQEIPVGKHDFERFKEGDELSSEFDYGGLLVNGDVANYEVLVANKRISTKYFLKFEGQNRQEISKFKYQQLSEVLISKYRSRVNTYELFGAQVIRLLDRDITSFTVKAVKPIKLRIATIEITNNSIFTGDILKQFRNADLTHRFELEVPAANQMEQMRFDTGLQLRNIILSGHLSSLHSEIVQTRLIDDPTYSMVETNEGPILILHTSSAAKLKN